MLPWLELALRLAAAALSLLIAAGFLGSFTPAFDSLAHFRAHLAVLLAALAGVLGLAALWPECLFALFFSLAALASIRAMPLPAWGKSAVGQPSYRLLQLNLMYDSTLPTPALELIRRRKPDILLLEEVSAVWEDELAGLVDLYPYKIICRPPDSDGVAVLSSRAFATGRPAACFENRLLAVAAVDLDGWQLECAALHLAWPWPFAQPKEIADLSAAFGGLGPDAILAGDLNAVPWSGAARRIARAGALKIIHGIGPTWLPSALPEFLRFAGLSIDQVMVKGNVSVHSVRRLPPVGSDHLPLLVEFSRRTAP